MSAAGRAKINSLHVYGPAGHVLTSGVEDDQWEAGYSTGIISHLLQTWLSIDPANITETVAGRQIYRLDVTRDRVSRALRDINNSAGTIVYFRLDNKIEIDWNTLLGMGGWPDVFFAWTRSNTRSIRFVRKTRTNVAQVVVTLTNQEEEETFEAVYPSVAFSLGDIIEESTGLLIGDIDDAVSIAEMLYHSKSLTDDVTIVVKGIAEWALPGQRHTVDFDVDEDNTYLNGHSVVVDSVSHRINLGDAYGRGKAWVTELTTRRVEYAY